MRRKFLLATLTSILLGASALPAAATGTDTLTDVVDTVVTASGAGDVVEPIAGNLLEPIGGNLLEPADGFDPFAVTDQDSTQSSKDDDDPIVIGEDGYGELSVDPDTLTVGIRIDPLGIDESISLLPAGDEGEPAADAPVAQPVAAQPAASQPAPVAPAASEPEPVQDLAASTPATTSSVPHNVFKPRPRDVFTSRAPSSTFEFTTPVPAAPAVADGPNASGFFDDAATNELLQNNLLKLFALLMFGSTGYAWWFAKENGLV